MKIISSKPTGEIDVKRFYLDGVVVSGNCPKCKEPVELDLGEQYLSYPPMNKPFKESMYCQECDHEFEVKLRVNISVDLIEEGK